MWVGKSLEMSVMKNKTVISNTNRNIWRRCCCAPETIVCLIYSTVLWSLKDKASRIERIVGEHRLFSQGLKELQDWVCEAQRVLNTCISTTTDKGVLEDRMLQLEVRRDKTDVGSLKGIHHNFQRLGCLVSTAIPSSVLCWHFQWFISRKLAFWENQVL